MRDRRKVRRQLGVDRHRFERRLAPAIAVPPDQRVHDGILAEVRHARRHDEELAAVRHREPRAVDGLVPEPRRAVLHGVEVGDAPAERRLDSLDVDLGRQRGGRAERIASGRASAAFAGEDAAQDRLLVTSVDDGEDEQHPATLLEEAIEAAVEQLPDGRIDPPQRLLDPVDSAEEMAALNRLRAAEPDRHMLRVAAEPRHLVWHHLSDGNDEIVGTVDERSVDGEGQREAERMPDDLVDLVRGELTDRRHVVAPTVVQHARGVDRVAEHEPALGRPERLMRTERGHDIDALDVALEEPGE